MVRRCKVETTKAESVGGYSQPMTMTQMEKIFSELVLGETFPKPTLVRLLKVK